MALSQRLELRQAQSLVMTPQLQQAIKLLQLSNLELASFVDEELERNPLLERADDSGTDPAPSGVDAPPEADTVAPEIRDAASLTSGDTIAGDNDLPLDVAIEETFDPEGPGVTADPSLGGWQAPSAGGGRGFDDSMPDLEQTLAETIGLRAHLEEQLALGLESPADRLIALSLIDGLDEAGYLRTDPDDLATQLGCDPADMHRVLSVLQRFDPPGVFARSLSECLALQLLEKNRLDPAIQTLLDNLTLLARRDLAQLIRLCQVDMDDMQEMIAEIRALNPKPAAAFSDVVADPVIPDILMRPQPSGGWLIELNPDTLPKVLVNQSYYKVVATDARSKEDRDYLGDRLASANWLVKSLHQRATTILRVATEIVQQQDGFFAFGVQFLKPLILRDIAEAIGMHESTVSRVTTNKYIATPRGVFELKYFFTSAISGTQAGATHSAEAVRHRIKTLIDQEAPNDILSDDRIVETLRADGVDIARRTVAKYREALRIPSSVQRRRNKAMSL